MFQSKDPYVGRKPASLLVHVALDRWSKRMLRADNTSVIVAYFDPPGLHSDSLLRQPSDLSTASTLKASDGEDDSSSSSSSSSSSDSELDEIFPTDSIDIISEDSHQASMTPPLPSRPLMDSYRSSGSKPALKRLPPSSSNRPLSPRSILARKPRSLPHSMARHIKPSLSSLTALGKSAKHHNSMYKNVKEHKARLAEVVMGTENDPNKMSGVSTASLGTSNKRAQPADSKVAKRPRLASPESSHIADSPMVLDGRQRRHVSQQTPSCSPLNIDLAASVTADLAMVSPLWPSHLADDLDLNEPVTAIKPKLGKGSEALMRDVLQENLAAAIPAIRTSSCESPASSDTMSSSSKCATTSQGSQNRSPATRASIRRLATPSPRHPRLSTYSAKLQAVHRGRTVRRAAPKRSS